MVRGNWRLLGPRVCVPSGPWISESWFVQVHAVLSTVPSVLSQDGTAPSFWGRTGTDGRTAVDGEVLAHITKIIPKSFQLLFWPWCKICEHLLHPYYFWLCFFKDYALCTQDFIHSEACITLLGSIGSHLKINSNRPMTVDDGRHSVRLE